MSKKLPPASCFQNLQTQAAQTGLNLAECEASRTEEKKANKKKKKAANETAEPAAAEPAACAAEAAEAGQPVAADPPEADSRQNAEKHIHSMMQAAAIALARDWNFQASAMIHHFVQPFAETHSNLVKILQQGAAGAVSLYLGYAEGNRLQPCWEALAKLRCPKALADCGLLLEVGLESHVEALDTDSLTEEQNSQAAHADALVWELVRQTAFAGTQFTDTVQGKLALLLSPHPEKVQAALAWLQERFETHEEAQKRPSPNIAALLFRSDCDRPVESRILRRLRETNFEEVPEDVTRDVREIFNAEVSTGIVENAFKELRAKESGGHRFNCN